MAKKKKRVKYFWLLSLLVLLPGFCLGAAPTPTPGHHNWLSNHPTTAARKNLHQPGYIVADAAARAAVTTMRDGDILYQQDTDVYYLYDGAAWLEFCMVAEAQTLTNKTLTSAVLNTGVSGTAVLDEDTMTSNSDTKVATQQSIKAYVDSQVSGVATGDWEKIGATQTASASATINFSSLDTATYRDFKVMISDVIPATDSTNFHCRLSIAAAWQSGASDYRWAIDGYASAASVVDAADDADTEIQIAGGSGTDTAESSSYEVILWAPSSTANHKKVTSVGVRAGDDGHISAQQSAGKLLSTSAVDGIQFLFSSGNIESGTFTLYGRRN